MILAADNYLATGRAMPRIFLLTTLFLALSVSASAQTLQSKYDSGEKALGQGKYEDAAVIFTDVYHRLSARQRDSLVGGQIRFRLGKSLMLTGQYRSAIAQLELAIPTLAKSGEVAADELAEAHYFLGLAYEALGEMALAVEQGQQAIARPGLPFRYAARLAMARAAIFVDRPLARRVFDELIQEFVPDANSKLSGDRLGELLAMRSRVELNDGKFAEARKWGEQALKRAGGTGTKVSLSDVRLRGDLSMASYLGGDEKRGIEMLAWTGIGRVSSSPEFPSERGITLPDCAPSGVVERDDMLIADISIRDDGTVSYFRPIYSTRPGKIEAAFADAVYRWTWTEDKLKSVEPFWRAALRIELRCLTQSSRRWIGSPFVAELGEAVNIPQVSDHGRPLRQQMAALRERLQALEVDDKENSLEALGILMRLLMRDQATDNEPENYARRAIEIADRIPLSARNRAIVRVMVMAWSGSTAATSTLVQAAGPDWPPDVRAWFDAEMGLRAERREADAEARTRYESVISSGLPKSDPIVQFAALRLASIYYADRNMGEASSLIADSGLRPDQCSLLDAGPIVDSLKFSSFDYPPKAQAFGFDGWTMVATDVGVDGRPVKPRTVFAYPPFLFDKSVERIMQRTRFKPIYREGSPIGCSDFRYRFRFSIPKSD